MAIAEFAPDVNPLFREGERNCVIGRFDRWSYQDVRDNTSAIPAVLWAGKMPGDEQWRSEDIGLFEHGSFWWDGRVRLGPPPDHDPKEPARGGTLVARRAVEWQPSTNELPLACVGGGARPWGYRTRRGAPDGQ
jgi:hypothetical protein